MRRTPDQSRRHPQQQMHIPIPELAAPGMEPRRGGVEVLEGATPHVHARESAEPDETGVRGAVAEVSDRHHSALFLTLDELLLKQRNERVALARVSNIPAQLDHTEAQ